MPLSLVQAQELIAAAQDHAAVNGWRITVAVVDEGGDDDRACVEAGLRAVFPGWMPA